jgi:CPA2 family monovalent cation:H+ antiporter-2
MLATHALALVGVPTRRVIRIVQEQRDARYKLLRGFHRADDDTASSNQRLSLSPCLSGPPTSGMASASWRANVSAAWWRAAAAANRSIRTPTAARGWRHARALRPADTLALAGKLMQG